jgi:hypothetical protein
VRIPRQPHLFYEPRTSLLQHIFIDPPHSSKEPEGLVARHEVQKRVCLRAVADEVAGVGVCERKAAYVGLARGRLQVARQDSQSGSLYNISNKRKQRGSQEFRWYN